MARNPKRLHYENRQKLNAADRRKIVAANILAGATYREIAAQQNVALSTIAGDFKAIMKEWRKHYTRDIDEWVKIQLRRLDVMINAVWDKARDGDTQAIDRVLKIMERQEKLLGIDINRIDVTSDGHAIARATMIEIVKDYEGSAGGNTNDDNDTTSPPKTL